MSNETSQTVSPDDDAEQGNRESTTDRGAPIGEGNYEGTQRYAEGIETYLANANVAKHAADVAPDSSEAADAMEIGEEEAARRSRAPGQ